jgi:hypothetical protein
MCSSNELNDHQQDHTSERLFSLFDKATLRQLRSNGKHLASRANVASTILNKSLFQTNFHPFKLFYGAQSRTAAAYFWGHRQDGFRLNVPEAEAIAQLSNWRMANQNARHANNGLFSNANPAKTSSKVLRQVIECLGDCPRLLAELANSESSEVRIAVAENAHTRLSTLFALAGDSNPDTRLAIAENHNAPIAILQFLAEDSNPYVTARAQRTLSRLIYSHVDTSMLDRLSRDRTKKRARA